MVAKLEQDENEPLSWIEWIYIFIVESLSCADMVTDILILIQLYAKEHLWWTTFTIIFIISPYLVSYTAVGTMLQKKSNLLSVFVMTPLCVIYFLILDTVFMIYAVISSLIFLITLSRVNITNWIENHVFYTFLSLSRMNIIGYRRLRTLGQLLFETFPSIILQIRMLYVLGDNGQELNVSFQSLYYSIGFAILHTIMEATILYLDSKACYLSLEEYIVICLNARLSWIPFANILRDFDNKCYEYTILDFEQITSTVCGTKYKLDFEFSKNSWDILIKYINSMTSFSPNIILTKTNIVDAGNIETEEIDTSHVGGDLNVDNLLAPLLSMKLKNGWNKAVNEISFYNHALRVAPHVMELKFGQQCCKNLNLFDLYLLFQVASNKVLINCGDINWDRCILLSQTKYTDEQVLDISVVMIEYFVKIGDFDTMTRFMTAVLNSSFGEYSLQTRQLLNINDFLNLLKIDILSNCKYNLYPLMKCYEYGVIFGLNCNESSILYSIVYQLLRAHFLTYVNGNNEFSWNTGKYVYTAMLLLWYTQGTIANHRCHECDDDWIDHMIKLEASQKSRVDGTLNGDENSDNNGNTTNNNKSDDNLRPAIEQLMTIYVPEFCSLKWQYQRRQLRIDSVCTSRNMLRSINDLFGEYLYTKAYSCLFGAAVDNSKSKSMVNLPDKLKSEIVTNGCMLAFGGGGYGTMPQFINPVIEIAKLTKWKQFEQSLSSMLNSQDKIVRKHETELEMISDDAEQTVFRLKFDDITKVCVCLYLYCCAFCFFVFINTSIATCLKNYILQHHDPSDDIFAETPMVCIESIDLDTNGQVVKTKFVQAYLLVPTNIKSNIDDNTNEKNSVDVEVAFNQIVLPDVSRQETIMTRTITHKCPLKLIYSFMYDMQNAALKIVFKKSNNDTVTRVSGIVSYRYLFKNPDQANKFAMVTPNTTNGDNATSDPVATLSNALKLKVCKILLICHI